jgi:hypothetical protein
MSKKQTKLSSLLIFASVLFFSASFVLTNSSSTDALTLDRGYLIDDAVMLNSATMSSSDIRRFLDQHGPACSVSVCLRNFTQDGKGAATIISEVSTEAGINPQVLLALLETENMLVSDASPSTEQFQLAAGHSCGVDPLCNNFKAQVDYAANLLFETTTNPSSSYLTFHAGQSAIPYNPNPACLTANVIIGTQATAALYSYEGLGYTPNDAAIQAPPSAGDQCSTYGIRNFYYNFKKWFGSPTSHDTSPLSTAYVYRFGNMPNNTHFWTKDTYEKDSMVRDGYRHEGLGWRVSPDPTPFPVYRLYNSSIRQHLFTQDSWEVHILTTSAGWQTEGIAWYSTTAGDPVYRLYSPINHEHFFTTDSHERSVLIANGTFKDEGVAWSQP